MLYSLREEIIDIHLVVLVWGSECSMADKYRYSPRPPYICIYMVVEKSIIFEITEKYIYGGRELVAKLSKIFAPTARILRETKPYKGFLGFYLGRRKPFRVFVFVLNNFKVKTSIFQGFWTFKIHIISLSAVLSPVNLIVYIWWYEIENCPTNRQSIYMVEYIYGGRGLYTLLPLGALCGRSLKSHIRCPWVRREFVRRFCVFCCQWYS